MERLKKAVLTGFVFTLLLSLLPVLSLWLLDRDDDPIGSLVSQSTAVFREVFLPSSAEGMSSS